MFRCDGQRGLQLHEPVLRFGRRLFQRYFQQRQRRGLQVRDIPQRRSVVQTLELLTQLVQLLAFPARIEFPRLRGGRR